MSLDDKEKVLKNIFANIEMINEKDKSSIIAYIRGTCDTRERVIFEQKESVQHETKKH